MLVADLKGTALSKEDLVEENARRIEKCQKIAFTKFGDTLTEVRGCRVVSLSLFSFLYKARQREERGKEGRC